MTSKSKYRAVLWDVDGTLAKSSNLAFSSTNVVLKNNNYEIITESEYHYGSRYNTPQRFSWHVTGNHIDESGIGETLGAQFDEYYVNLVSPSSTGLYPFIWDLLRKIKTVDNTIYLGALSNACGAYVRAVVKANNLEDIFALSLGADDVDASKPDPAGLLKCCSILNISSSESIYVGDSPTDAEAAAAAGMTSVGVTWGSGSTAVIQEKFDYTAQTVNELNDILFSLLNQ